jgi:hypothetical protein
MAERIIDAAKKANKVLNINPGMTNPKKSKPANLYGRMIIPETKIVKR